MAECGFEARFQFWWYHCPATLSQLYPLANVRFNIFVLFKNTVIMQKIKPFLWFDGRAEEAMNFYTSVFPHARVGNISRAADGRVFTCEFMLEDMSFIALNGGPMFTFTEAVSFFINCDTQEEVDRYWDRLSEGGARQRCGWLKDKFGLSWQVVPTTLGRLLSDKDAEKAGRVMQAMLKMDKIDIATLEAAYAGV